MSTSSEFTATFNPKIKQYILYLVAFFFLISLVGILFLPVWFLGFGQYISGRYYDNLHCVLTERNLIFRKGIWLRVEKTIPLENIQDLTFVTNPLLDYFDLKILKIETAGHSMSSGADMKLVGISNAEKFKNTVLEQRETLCSVANTPSESQTHTELLREIRDMVRQIAAKD